GLVLLRAGGRAGARAHPLQVDSVTIPVVKAVLAFLGRPGVPRRLLPFVLLVALGGLGHRRSPRSATWRRLSPATRLLPSTRVSRSTRRPRSPRWPRLPFSSSENSSR